MNNKKEVMLDEDGIIFCPSIKKEVKLNEDGVLLCPCCHGDYLHEQDFDSFEINASKSYQENDNSEHKKFYCENCPSNPVLKIFQHKGRTLMRWLSIRIMLN